MSEKCAHSSASRILCHEFMTPGPTHHTEGTRDLKKRRLVRTFAVQFLAIVLRPLTAPVAFPARTPEPRTSQFIFPSTHNQF